MARKRRSSSPRAKPVTLDPDIWLRNSKDIAQYRASELFEQEGKCAISSLPLEVSNSCVDHLHFGGMCPDQVEGRCRGVIESQINMLEGKYLKLFKKSRLHEKYGITFPELLINLGEYLQRDNSDKPYHFEVMTTLRKYINRLTRKEICNKIYTDFKLEAVETEPKVDLVQRYCQAFVDMLEIKYKEE